MLTRWDVLLLTGAMCVAVGSLVRLMRARRNQLVTEVQKQIDEQRIEQARAAREAKKKEVA